MRVARLVGVAATGAGLLPIAAGYLIAHYFTYLLIDGQRIIVALADPLQQGWDLGGFGWAFFEPTPAFLPPGLVWTIQIAAVVGGHMLGAWAGHVVYMRRSTAEGLGRRREVPLAVIMVALTTLTLWSLGQTLVVEAPAAALPVAVSPASVVREPLGLGPTDPEQPRQRAASSVEDAYVRGPASAAAGVTPPA